jgi:hypothetical protein
VRWQPSPRAFSIAQRRCGNGRASPAAAHSRWYWRGSEGCRAGAVTRRPRQWPCGTACADRPRAPPRTWVLLSDRRHWHATSPGSLPNTVNKSDVSPGLLATRLAGRPAVLAGRAARRSRANVRHPAAAHAPRRAHSSLTAWLGPCRAGHGPWRGGDAPSARAASLASSAALPVRSGAAVAEAVDPYASGYASPLRWPPAHPPHRPEVGSPHP